MSQRAGVPANYLSKILLALGNAGILAATRGTGGGYRLRRRPDQVRLIEVVDLFDRTRARPACFLGGRKDCSDTNPCSAHPEWKGVRASYLCFLENTTLAQIAQHEPVKPKKRKR